MFLLKKKKKKLVETMATLMVQNREAGLGRTRLVYINEIRATTPNPQTKSEM